MPLSLPHEYLSLTLAEVLALAPNGAPKLGDAVAVASIVHALNAFAERVAREDLDREREWREWLEQQFYSLTTELADK